nr:hypothetical protein Iba_chr13dCG3350 [Ipomoea batatas]
MRIPRAIVERHQLHGRCSEAEFSGVHVRPEVPPIVDVHVEFPARPFHNISIFNLEALSVWLLHGNGLQWLHSGSPVFYSVPSVIRAFSFWDRYLRMGVINVNHFSTIKINCPNHPGAAALQITSSISTPRAEIAFLNTKLENVASKAVEASSADMEGVQQQTLFLLEEDLFHLKTSDLSGSSKDNEWILKEEPENG